MSGPGPDREHLERVIGTCLHCGLCLPACPTYDVTLDERSSPRGRIRLIRSVLDGSLTPGREFADEMNFCLDCRACEPACPAGVRYGELVEHARTIVRDGKLEPLLGRIRKFLILRMVFGSRRAFAGFAALLRLYHASGLREAVERSGILEVLPRALRRMVLALPGAAERPYLDTVPELIPAPKPAAGRVGLLTGCVMNVSFPGVHRDTADLLGRAGFDVVVPRSQFCCGSLHGHNGEKDLAMRFAAELIGSFPDGLDAVVVNSAGCGAFMKEYGRLFRENPGLSGPAAGFSAKVADVSEFLDRHRPAGGDAGLGGELVTYHDACHLIHGQGISRQPRSLIASIPGVRFTELRDASRCCGSAGIYNVVRPDDSDRFLRAKVDAIVATGARIVVTGNPGCHLQIERGLRETGSTVEVLHPVTLLRRAAGGRTA